MSDRLKRLGGWLARRAENVLVLMLGNFVLGMFGVGGGEGMGLRSGGPLAIIFSLVCIGLAAQRQLQLPLELGIEDPGIGIGAQAGDQGTAGGPPLAGVTGQYYP